MKILLTGFEPFGESTLNPSQKLIESLPEKLFDDVQLIRAILPVDQNLGPKKLLAQIHQHQPDAVLSFGLSSGRSKISLERVALNLMDFRIPDNSGKKVSDKTVVEDGPAAYFTTLPVREMLEALQSSGIPAELSLTAGAYLCNQVFYLMMHEINQKQLPIRAGFIHLPALPEQAAHSARSLPSLCLDQAIKAAEILVTILQQTHTTLK